MRVTYDPVADSMFIYFSRKKSTQTKEIAPNVLADFNGRELVGIEILEASKRLSKHDLKKLTLEIPTYQQRASVI